MPRKRGCRGSRSGGGAQGEAKAPGLGTAPAQRVGSPAECTCAGIPPHELDCLFELFECTQGPLWKNSTNWLTDAPVDSWKGVKVREGRVSELGLNSNGLRGELPDLSPLSQLTKLGFAQNRLGGPLPALERLPGLQTARLAHNRFASELPEALGELPELRYLHVQDNKLYGQIPVSLLHREGLDLRCHKNSELVGSEASLHVPQFPMYFMPREAVLSLTRIPHHELAKSQELLGQVDIHNTAYTSFRVVFGGDKGTVAHAVSREHCGFLSHRWLRPHMDGIPAAHVDDEDNSKLAHIQALLERHPEVAWVWLDFWSCPQQELGAQQSCIKSIAYYIHCCEHFFILAHHRHSESPADRSSLQGYLAGGWCRFEVLVASCPYWCSEAAQWALSCPAVSVHTEGDQHAVVLEQFVVEPEQDQFFDPRDFETIKPVMALVMQRKAQYASLEPHHSHHTATEC